MIDALGYIGVTSPRAADWATFGPEVLGLQDAGRGPDGSVRLRLDDAVHRVVIHPGPTDDLAYLGWRTAGPAALELAAGTLADRGVDVRRGDDDLCRERAVSGLVWFVDPFGFRHELTWGQLSRPGTFRPGRSLSGFVTGEGGLGHAVLVVPDLSAAEKFYLGVLDLGLSDRIEIPSMSLRFLHCNPRHHSLAFAVREGHVGMHHLMLEVASLDDVGHALDLCRARGVPITQGLGRHTNDRMTSFYLRSPSGFDIEYGWGGALVDAAAPAGYYDAMSSWGHERLDPPLPPGILRPVT